MYTFESAFLIFLFLGIILFSKEIVMPKRYYEREEGRRIRDYLKRKASIASKN